jgi:uncharacterized protein (DUF362 family)
VNGSKLWSRRRAIQVGLVTGGGAFLLKEGVHAWVNRERPWEAKRELGLTSQVFIGRAASYTVHLSGILLQGFQELSVRRKEITGKTILLKPNLVEPQLTEGHINTHPLLVRAAVEAFMSLGASSVLVAEGAGHRRDSVEVLEVSGLGEVLREDRISFVDLNYETGYKATNLGLYTKLATLTLPEIFRRVDWIVSMPKLKTHHWAGVTLSMKNLFGVLPGIYYGWPKNVLHYVGIQNSILDLTATVKPSFCIVDGIVGMEGDGPIMGEAKKAGVIVMGRNPVSVDATAARLMTIDPAKISYLKEASGWLGSIGEMNIRQVGENLDSSKSLFRLEENFDAMKDIRLSNT